MKNRRRFISGIVTGSIVSVTGCAGSDIGGISGDFQTNQTKPEAVVEQFAAAISSGNAQTATELLHPESPSAPITQEDLSASSEVTVSDVRQISPKKVVELNAEVSGGEVTQEERQNRVSSLNEKIDSLLESAGAENHAFVAFAAQRDVRREEFLLSVVQDNDNWSIYQFPSEIASIPIPGAETTTRITKFIRFIQIVGSGTEGGKIDSLKLHIVLSGESDPVSMENISFTIVAQDTAVQLSGDKSTSGLVYEQLQSLDDGKTTLSEPEDRIVAILDLTEINGISPLEPNQEANIIANPREGIQDMKGYSMEIITPSNITADEEYNL